MAGCDTTEIELSYADFVHDIPKVEGQSVAEGLRTNVLKWATGDYKLPSPSTLEEIRPHLSFYGSCFPQGVVQYAITQNKAEGKQQLLSSIRQRMLGIAVDFKVYLIAHGFLGNINNSWMRDIKDNILATETSAVVILLGWGDGCDNVVKYMQAVANIRVVGEAVAATIFSFMFGKMKRMPLLIGVGHSLGAHLMAAISRCCKKREGIIFSRICGLDPAGVGLEEEDSSEGERKRAGKSHKGLMLTSSDAELVDVIHTDGCAADNTGHFLHESSHPSVPEDIVNPAAYFGTMLPLGHFDFYPNGGHDQPGCKWGMSGSHSFAHRYFIDSFDRQFVTNKRLVQDPVQGEKIVNNFHPLEKVNVVKMGFHCNGKNQDQRGNYYINMDVLYR